MRAPREGADPPALRSSGSDTPRCCESRKRRSCAAAGSSGGIRSLRLPLGTPSSRSFPPFSLPPERGRRSQGSDSRVRRARRERASGSRSAARRGAWRRSMPPARSNATRPGRSPRRRTPIGGRPRSTLQREGGSKGLEAERCCECTRIGCFCVAALSNSSKHCAEFAAARCRRVSIGASCCDSNARAALACSRSRVSIPRRAPHSFPHFLLRGALVLRAFSAITSSERACSRYPRVATIVFSDCAWVRARDSASRAFTISFSN